MLVRGEVDLDGPSQVTVFLQEMHDRFIASRLVRWALQRFLTADSQRNHSWLIDDGLQCLRQAFGLPETLIFTRLTLNRSLHLNLSFLRVLHGATLL